MNFIHYFYIGGNNIVKFIFSFFKWIISGIFTLITILPHYLISGIKFITSKNKSNTSKENNIENKFISIIILSLSVVTYLISIFIITRWYVQNERAKKFINSFENYPVEINKDTPDQYKDLTNIPAVSENNNYNNSEINANFINVNLNYYTQKNPETVAWIQVNGTKVKYPVVQHNNNDYYLEHDFYQNKTINGWIFGDYRDNFEKFNNNTIIYGHNLINGTMFGTIPNLLNIKWFNNPNNHYIKLSTKTTNSIWKIFSVYKIEPTTDYLQVKFNSIKAYQEFLNTIKERSTYNFNIDTNYTDKIITLSTCDNIGTHRVVVHAKLIKIENK